MRYFEKLYRDVRSAQWAGFVLWVVAFVLWVVAFVLWVVAFVLTLGWAGAAIYLVILTISVFGAR